MSGAKMGKLIDLTGRRFGRLTVLERSGATKNKEAKWRCRCDCGMEVIVTSSNLRNGRQVSCGCLRQEKSLNRIQDYNSTHKATRNKRLYKIWLGMRNRCENQKHQAYSWYGGRGIKICNEWGIYEIFERWALSSGYLPTLTIDRINVNGDYTPDNCRWVTRQEQAYNRRDNRRLTFKGESLTITEWAKRLGCSPTCLYYRLDAGWPTEEILTVPPNRTKRHK